MVETSIGTWLTVDKDRAEVYFQIWDGSWIGKLNDDIHRWNNSGVSDRDNPLHDLDRKLSDNPNLPE
jgi:hypothetical protein